MPIQHTAAAAAPTEMVDKAVALTKFPRGTWRVIRASGEVEDMPAKPTFAAVNNALRTRSTGTVNLKDAHTHQHIGIVMFHADPFEDLALINRMGTVLYAINCRRDAQIEGIFGDVALVHDADFASDPFQPHPED